MEQTNTIATGTKIWYMYQPYVYVCIMLQCNDVSLSLVHLKAVKQM